jgi:hypothetical protein
MNPNRLQVGIDFSLKRADVCLLFADGQPLLSHPAFANTRMGYQKARQMLLDSLHAYGFDGLDVSREATSYYWFPFFWQLAHDAELGACALSLFLLNPRHEFCMIQDRRKNDTAQAEGNPLQRCHEPKFCVFEHCADRTKRSDIFHACLNEFLAQRNEQHGVECANNQEY